MRLRKLLAAFLASSALAIAPGYAQDLGSASGVVFGPGGTPVGDATVKITGDLLPAGRTVRTDENGVFQLPALLPGAYTITAEKQGVGSSTRGMQVDVGKDTQIDFVLGVEVKEDVVVSASSPVVDLKSSEVNFNYKADQIVALPLQRN